MKIRSIFTCAAAAVTAAILTAGAAAYDLNTDLSTFWSASVTVPAGEFAALTPDSYITISIKTDESLADVEGHSYWVIKPMINDAGWPLITGITELPLSEDGSSYVIEPGAEAVTFSIPADQLEHVQLAGIAFMGHGVTLETLDITDEPPAAAIPEDTVKENPNTGVEGAAGIAAIGVIGAAVMFISRKRK